MALQLKNTTSNNGTLPKKEDKKPQLHHMFGTKFEAL